MNRATAFLNGLEIVLALIAVVDQADNKVLGDPRRAAKGIARRRVGGNHPGRDR